MKTAQGWSLLELMLVLAIITLLSLAGSISFKHYFQRAESQHAAEMIIKLLKYTQQQASYRKQTLTVCPLINKACSKTGAQHIGVFVDTNNNRRIDENEELLSLKRISEEKSHLVIRASFGRPYFRFNASARALESGTIFYCPERDDLYGQAITLNLAGRAYIVEEKTVLEEKMDC